MTPRLKRVAIIATDGLIVLWCVLTILFIQKNERIQLDKAELTIALMPFFLFFARWVTYAFWFIGRSNKRDKKFHFTAMQLLLFLFVGILCFVIGAIIYFFLI